MLSMILTSNHVLHNSGTGHVECDIQLNSDIEADIDLSFSGLYHKSLVKVIGDLKYVVQLQNQLTCR